MAYDPSFLSQKLAVTFPSSKEERCTEMVHYVNFSVCHDYDRRLALFTAVNINGRHRVEIARKNNYWKFDNSIGRDKQLGNSFYRAAGGSFDRGHLVRRLDPAWGDNAKKAELDTFNFTNCAPQHRKFNRELWLELERNVLEKGAVDSERKISVFTGPVLQTADYFVTILGGKRQFSIQIPSLFWKIIVWRKADQRLYAVGFVMSQWELISGIVGLSDAQRGVSDDYFQKMEFNRNGFYQVNINTIRDLTSLEFNWEDMEFPYNETTHTQLKLYENEVSRSRTKHDMKMKAGGQRREPLDVIVNLVL